MRDVEFTYNLDSDIVSRYLLSLDAAREEPDVTHLKLQKILYFAQANYLASTGQRLFDEPLEAFEHGPVVYPVYRQFTGMGANIIAAQLRPSYDESELPEDVSNFLDQIWDLYKDFTPSQLRKLTHLQDPWKDNYVRGEFRKEIPDYDLIEYFRSKVPYSKRVLHSNVVTVDQETLDELDSDEDEIVARAIEAFR